MAPKRVTSIRLSVEAKRLVERLAKSLGLTQGGVIELAIRRFWDEERNRKPRAPN